MEIAVRAFVMLAAASAIAPLLRRASPAARHLYWHAAIVATLALPVLSMLTPTWRVASSPAIAGALANASASLALPALSAPSSPSPSFDSAGQGPGFNRSRAPARRWARIAGAGWLTGSAIVVTFFTFGYLRIARIRRQARPAALAWSSNATRTASRLGLRRTPAVLVSNDVHGPITAGWLTPVVIVPAGAEAWSADRREAVVAHELAHVVRHDCRTQVIAQVLCAAHWFNPLSWRAAWQLQCQRERACDAEVLRLGITPSTYASELLAIASSLNDRRTPVAALAMARRSEFEGRLLAVLAGSHPARSKAARLIAIAGVAGLAVIVAGARVGRAEDRPFLPPMLLPAPSIAMTMATSGAEPQASPAQSGTPPGPVVVVQKNISDAMYPRALDSLLKGVDDPDAAVRERAALAIGFWPDDAAGDALIRALTDPDPQVREKAAIGLALRRRPGAIGPLLAAMRDPDSQVREKVAIALGTTGSDEAWPALSAAMTDPDPQVREKVAAAMILLKTGSPGIAESDALPAAVRLGLRLIESLVK